MPQLVVFGAAHVDRLLTLPGAAIPGASNPVRAVEHAGGVGLNVAATAARLGVATVIASRLGRDAAAERVLVEAKTAGLAGLFQRSGSAPTASYTAVLDGTGALVIGLADMAIYDEFGPTDLRDARAAAPDATAWHVDANLPAAGLAMIAAAKGGRRLSASAVSPAKAPRLEPILGAVDLLFCNRGEAEVLSGMTGLSVEGLAERLRQRGVATAIVTDGGSSLGVAEAGRTARIDPPAATAIVSANGAGDALAGGTLAGLASGLPLAAALQWGLAAAALKLEVAEPARRDLTPERLAARRAAIAARTGAAA